MIVVLGVFLFLSQRSTRTDIDQTISDNTSQLRRSQQSLTSQRQQVESLHAAISQLQGQQVATGEANRLLTGDKKDWYTALTALFGAQTSGVIYQSVTAEPEGRVLLGGLATEPGSKASLPTQFSNISDILDFQGILWSAGTDPPAFAASFQVVQ